MDFFITDIIESLYYIGGITFLLSLLAYSLFVLSLKKTKKSELHSLDLSLVTTYSMLWFLMSLLLFGVNQAFLGHLFKNEVPFSVKISILVSFLLVELLLTGIVFLFAKLFIWCFPKVKSEKKQGIQIWMMPVGFLILALFFLLIMHLPENITAVIANPKIMTPLLLTFFVLITFGPEIKIRKTKLINEMKAGFLLNDARELAKPLKLDNVKLYILKDSFQKPLSTVFYPFRQDICVGEKLGDSLGREEMRVLLAAELHNMKKAYRLIDILITGAIITSFVFITESYVFNLLSFSIVVVNISYQSVLKYGYYYAADQLGPAVVISTLKKLKELPGNMGFFATEPATDPTGNIIEKIAKRYDLDYEPAGD